MINLIKKEGVNEVTNFCKNCGAQLNTDNGFCSSCGAQVGTVTTNPVNAANTGEKDNTVPAFILSLLGFLCCTYLAIPGMIMSVLSLQKMNKGELATKNKGLAIAGIVLGALGILMLVKNLVAPNPDVTEMVNEILNA